MASLACLPGAAHADPKAEVTELLRANLAAIAASDNTAFDATFHAHAARVLPDSGASSLVAKFYGPAAEVVQHVPHVTIAVDKNVAWFSGTVDASFEIRFVNKPPGRGKTTWSVAGAAVDDGGWKLVAITYAPPFDVDAERNFAVEPVDKTGDVAIAGVIDDWIRKRSFPASEHSMSFGPPPKLWPPLHLVSIDVQRFRRVGVVTARVVWPLGARTGLDLTMTVIVVETKGVWRWIVLGLSGEADV